MDRRNRNRIESEAISKGVEALVTKFDLDQNEALATFSVAFANHLASSVGADGKEWLANSLKKIDASDRIRDAIKKASAE